jgi:hypothetical protein
LTGLSNWGLAFVFNKALWGVGSLAEGRRQKVAEEIAKIAKIAGLPPQQAKVGLAGGPGIAKIENQRH